jgi:hypothetical protein
MQAGRIRSIEKSNDLIDNLNFFLIDIVGGGVIGSTRHCGHQWPIVLAPGDYDDGEIGGIIGR